jgi:hypothetical protein
MDVPACMCHSSVPCADVSLIHALHHDRELPHGAQALPCARLCDDAARCLLLRAPCCSEPDAPEFHRQRLHEVAPPVWWPWHLHIRVSILPLQLQLPAQGPVPGGG